MFFSHPCFLHTVLEGAVEEEAEDPDSVTKHTTLSEESSKQEDNVVVQQSGGENEGMCLTRMECLINLKLQQGLQRNSSPLSVTYVYEYKIS